MASFPDGFETDFSWDPSFEGVCQHIQTGRFSPNGSQLNPTVQKTDELRKSMNENQRQWQQWQQELGRNATEVGEHLTVALRNTVHGIAAAFSAANNVKCGNIGKLIAAAEAFAATGTGIEAAKAVLEAVRGIIVVNGQYMIHSSPGTPHFPG